MRTSQLNLVPTLANTEVPLIGPSDRRRRLMFSTLATVAVILRNDPQGNAIGTGGLCIVLSGGPVELTFEEHGDIVSRAWFAYTAVASTVCVIETFD